MSDAKQTEAIGIRVEPEVLTALKAAAEAECRTVSGFCRNVLLAYLRRTKDERRFIMTDGW